MDLVINYFNILFLDNLILTCSESLGRGCSLSLIDYGFINDSEHITLFNPDKHSVEHQIDYDGDLVYDYLEHPKTYENYLNQIKSWFPKIEKTHNKDLVVHIRRGDNGDNINTSIDWYLRVMGEIDYDNVFLVTDEPNHKDILTLVKETDAKVFSKTNIMNRDVDKNYVSEIITDFNFIRRFDKILFSNSTFGWWASLLSDASEIYFNSDWQLRHKNGRVQLGKTNYKNWRGYSETYS
jgi:hypothetical protein